MIYSREQKNVVNQLDMISWVIQVYGRRIAYKPPQVLCNDVNISKGAMDRFRPLNFRSAAKIVYDIRSHFRLPYCVGFGKSKFVLSVFCAPTFFKGQKPTTFDRGEEIR